ncbi:2-oxoglutarate dehydrogenase, E2 component, dihydrolipoamide succinyltransferase [Leptolyngbya sp. 7M]|uniref:2-oxoglutarate dehydrogenase, E2 component, dihydrolipoamide succinyltransferase n=1 Tax=Leptolyngbya sp. 7M TaxID=2812896 RepID=UPI001B8D7571|nr:2-oxoglutarate dehydrogenase, E2 component, dihydrolipoamide succinyltransferase [Leptolyngbya sp. 7M]QYO65572.1 2-oxoglutarate dehydrogenase, E2 component, dihydrolipoamide succinyltransferase [Leptolyngbya sp. 7M]
MSVEVVMPQMGESITEGTVSKWLKSVGDKIEKDEPILEISTDKVDAEVPSPSAGTLLEIRHQEGETVEVGTVLAMIGAEGEAVTPAPATQIQSPDPTPAPTSMSLTEPEAPVYDNVEAVSSTPASAGEAVSSSPEATEVVMPQMGESITEGTVSKWLKSVGDDIEKDEPILEISTDKVDAEVPSPAAGKLLAINVNEGETVEVGAVLALVGAEGAASTSKPPAVSAETESPSLTQPGSAPAPMPVAVTATTNGGKGNASVDELRRTRSSPLVRNIAKEHGIDITRIPGSGISGRVTKKDILSFIETGAALRPEDLLKKGVAAPTISSQPAQRSEYSAPSVIASAGDRVEKMSVMRKKIAEHMTYSKHTSAHVTSVYEIDMTNVAKFREANKKAFQERYGTKLTFMPFIFQGVTNAIRQFPIVNAQVDGDNIIYKGDINLGMAVALDWGLIVPVIRRADTLSLSGLALTANDLADRARLKKLNPDEVTGGTFTITNPGVFGGLYGTPIINQPQVAILCVGTIEKRPKVLTTPDGDDYIAIRQMAYFALTYDHRIVDGADAEKFLSYLKKYLETTDFAV